MRKTTQFIPSSTLNGHLIPQVALWGNHHISTMDSGPHAWEQLSVQSECYHSAVLVWAGSRKIS